VNYASSRLGSGRYAMQMFDGREFAPLVDEHGHLTFRN
jgi:hypothetical protein